MKFSRREIKDLFFAWLMISLAFAILLVGASSLIKLSSALIIAFVIAFFSAGIGFLLHEMMHKYVASRYRLESEFQASYGMLWLSLLFSLFGFIIAAPGGIYIKGKLTKESYGKISIAGPLTNIALAFLFLAFLLSFETGSLLKEFFRFGLSINSWLSLFNLIPAMPFDGAKVLYWDKKAYITAVVLAVAVFIMSFVV